MLGAPIAHVKVVELVVGRGPKLRVPLPFDLYGKEQGRRRTGYDVDSFVVGYMLFGDVFNSRIDRPKHFNQFVATGLLVFV